MSASKDLIDSIKIIYDNNIKNASFDKTYNGKISSVNTNGTYNVTINGVEYTNIKTMGGTCSLNELVKIRIPQNNYNNMYIDKHGNSGSSSSDVSSVNGKTGNVVLTQDDIGNGDTYVKTHNDFTDAYKSQIDTNEDNITDLQNNKLDKNGDNSNTTSSFTPSTTRSNISTGEKLSILFGKISKWFNDLGSLAFKSEVVKSDLSSGVQSSLNKADSALQSYTETDPTVPSWAKEDTKPTYTKGEIGLGNVDNKSSETIRSEITSKNVTSALGYTPLNSNLKGANNGLAELDDNGLIPSSQLPSYVDDVIEGYYYNNKFYQDTTHSQLINGESSKIYISLDTNVEYRWSGSQYVEISSSLALGETSSTAYRGDRGKIAYDHSQLTSGNPHKVNKTDIGLGNVENYKAVSTVANQGLSNTEKSNARNNIGAGTSSFSGSYNDLTNKPTIPSNTSDLTNDSGYITSIPIGGTSIGGVKNGGNVTINADGTMNASGTGNGDMLKANYATKSNTIVDEAYNSLSLGGKPANTFILSTDEGTAVDPNPINADTLNGHYASEFVMTNTEDFLKPTDVIDNLTSTNNEKPLSANQGKVLNTNINQLSTQKANINSPNFIGTPTVSSNTNYTTRQLRNIILSTSEPTSTDGQNGDIWIVYGG